MKMTETLQTMDLQFSSISPQILEKYQKKKKLQCVYMYVRAHTQPHACFKSIFMFGQR